MYKGFLRRRIRVPLRLRKWQVERMLTPGFRGLFKPAAFGFIERREANGFKLKNCPTHIHEWILREQNRRPNE